MESSKSLAILIISLGLFFGTKFAQNSANSDFYLLPDLSEMIPSQFGLWKKTETALVQSELAVNDEGHITTDSPYDVTLTRTYQNASGQQIMLAVAYGKDQRQEIKIHRPEVCYPAQGFVVNNFSEKEELALFGNVMPVNAFLAKKGDRLEAVIYWIRIGSSLAHNPFELRLHILKNGILGEKTDGILVRSSQIIRSERDYGPSLNLQIAFLEKFLNHIDSKSLKYFLTPQDAGAIEKIRSLP